MSFAATLVWANVALAQDTPRECESRPLDEDFPAATGEDDDPALRADLQALLNDAVTHQQTPAAALVVMRRGHIVFRGTAGIANLQNIFDVASLTKVVATAPSIMRLWEKKKLQLTTPVSQYLPALMRGEKKTITVEELLLHTSGLPAEVYAGRLTDGPKEILARVRDVHRRFIKTGSYRYSDIGFIILGELIKKVSGSDVDIFARDNFFRPLKMCDTFFRPSESLNSRLISPWPTGEKAGQVYDPLAARLGGVAGHAGLFSTVDDMARFGQMMLDKGRMGKASRARERVLAEKTVDQMIKPRTLPPPEKGKEPNGERGLGWDISSPHATVKGALSPQSYGHTGYTGTMLWIDPDRELVVVLLTNRTYYSPAPSVNQLRQRLNNILANALPAKIPSTIEPVESGLDRLEATKWRALRGKKFALITNRSAVDRRGRFILDLIAARRNLQLRALYVPEHGLSVKLDRRISDGKYQLGQRTVPLYSLFSKRRCPTDETLADAQALVFDVPTVGVRYYTYLSTMGCAMEAAARRKIPFYVLDRPNPLGGSVEGPVSVEERRTTTNYHPLPVRYGLTTGELAQLFNSERKLGARVIVIELNRYRRERLFNSLDLPWTNPSPNIRNLRQALLYAGSGMLETTNLSVGRGTDSPFQLLGAPWIDGEKLATAMNKRALPGIYFTAARFAPSQNPYKDEPCSGIRLLVTDATKLRPVEMGINLAVELRRQYATQWDTKNLYRLINHPKTVEAILTGKDAQEIEAGWEEELAAFIKQREEYLLYP